MNLPSLPFRILSLSLLSISLVACGGGDGDSIAENLNPTDIQCVNGIPKNLKTKGNGIFSEELFSIDTFSDQDDEDQVIFKSNRLENGVWYENLSQIIPNTLTRLNDEYYAGYHLTPKTLTTSFKQITTTAGLPWGYVTEQNKEALTVVPFSDSCDLSTERKIALHLDQLDLTGKTMADLLAYYELGNPKKAKRYLPSHVEQTLSQDRTLYQKLKTNPITFPAGSVIYFPDQEIYTTPSISFYESEKTDLRNLTEYTNDSSNRLPTGYTWKSDTFAGYKVVYPINSQTGAYAYFNEAYPGVEYQGGIYSGLGVIPGNYLKYSRNDSAEDIDMDTTYFNKTAAQTFANILKASQ